MTEYIISTLSVCLIFPFLLGLSYLRKSDKPLILAQCFLSFILFVLYFSEEMWLATSQVGHDLPILISGYFFSILLLCNEYREEFRYYSKKPSAFSVSTCINAIFSITIYFALIFNMHSVAMPNSFSNINTHDYLNRALDFYYFSLTTFTTVGFGDITALTSCARFLVLLEIAVAFYLMVIIVNFVYVVNSNDSKENTVVKSSSNTKVSKKNKNTKNKATKEKKIMSENGNTITTEEIHKELDLIQACITRMANNSFFVKGWLISIYAVVLALMGETLNSLLICFILTAVNIAFWWLDGFFLQAEKVYRKYTHGF